MFCQRWARVAPEGCSLLLTLRVSLVRGLLQLLVASTFLTQEASTAAQALHAWEEKHEIVKVREYGGKGGEERRRGERTNSVSGRVDAWVS